MWLTGPFLRFSKEKGANVSFSNIYAVSLIHPKGKCEFFPPLKVQKNQYFQC